MPAVQCKSGALHLTRTTTEGVTRSVPNSAYAPIWARRRLGGRGGPVRERRGALAGRKVLLYMCHVHSGRRTSALTHPGRRAGRRTPRSNCFLVKYLGQQTFSRLQ